MDIAYSFCLNFIKSMLGFAQSCYDFFVKGMDFADSTISNIFRRFELLMPGPNVVNFVHSVFTSFGTVLFVLLLFKVFMTIINLINPLS